MSKHSQPFETIDCPNRDKCHLVKCVFRHDQRATAEQEDNNAEKTHTSSRADPQGPPAKRRKLSNESHSSNSQEDASRIRLDISLARVRSSKTPVQGPGTDQASKSQTTTRLRDRHLKSLARSISPPASSSAADKSTTSNARPNSVPKIAAQHDAEKPNTNVRQTLVSKNDAVGNAKRFLAATDNGKLNTSSGNVANINTPPSESLNPRLVPRDPVGHAKRTAYLKQLHNAMAEFNKGIIADEVLENKQHLILTQAELVTLALNEEESAVLKQPEVYPNVIKLRIHSYKKMTREDWAQQLEKHLQKSPPNEAAKKEKANRIVISLGQEEQIALLPQLVADQNKLAAYGYVPTPPTEAQIAEAKATVAMSNDWEICDNCTARFQIFPDRNEEGLLASKGPCKHHSRRKVFPLRAKGEAAAGVQNDAYYPCCNERVGSPGCTKSQYHVFKAKDAARLAAVLPFVWTPDNSNPAKDKNGNEVKAVTFDCEMGYTVFGMELIRLTAVTWPQGQKLIDVLVRPMGTIMDLNSRFSGVFPENFANAVPYEEFILQGPPLPLSDTLPIVSSPQKARELLCTYLTPSTPLIGHGIENDLNTVRLCHPTIIDTVLLFPHPKGLPFRLGLRALTKQHLQRDIQMGGDRGHDSLEDAVATGDLVQVRMEELWKSLEAHGWRFVCGQLEMPEG